MSTAPKLTGIWSSSIYANHADDKDARIAELEAERDAAWDAAIEAAAEAVIDCGACGALATVRALKKGPKP